MMSTAGNVAQNKHYFNLFVKNQYCLPRFCILPNQDWTASETEIRNLMDKGRVESRFDPNAVELRAAAHP